MATDSKRTIKVFMASPGDLTKEREKFREAIKHLNEGFDDGTNVEYEPLQVALTPHGEQLLLFPSVGTP
ncbi:MAG: hypothetical protein B0D92_07580 [Spirochaeta sp. LUC14_002_19_P3]|nr:MAG: hypothetical protein B0D92_07580 [Spirochaeta sp. LUC14_002_19_P3]